MNFLGYIKFVVIHYYDNRKYSSILNLKTYLNELCNEICLSGISFLLIYLSGKFLKKFLNNYVLQLLIIKINCY